MALFGLFGRSRPAALPPRPRLVAEQWPAAIYAIGDIHGCLNLLRELEARIVGDAATIEGEKWIVLLGDYVDRGPDSAGVLDHLLSPAPIGFKRTVLAGNHEDLMLDFLASPTPGHDWLRLGGDRTLESYGINATALMRGQLSRRAGTELLASYIPDQHISLMQSMPACLSLPGTVFVHAGIRRGIPMNRQTDRDMLWMRPDPEELEPQDADAVLVVHGHTPAPQPYVTKYRICVDTGAFATRILTAVRLGNGGFQSLIATDPTPTP